MQERPKVTITISCYNHEAFVKEAVEAAFQQDYSPLEIVISDDCSSDGTFNIIEKLAHNYTGPHTVILNRNQTNLGLIAHVQKMFSIATGDLIVGTAGDDVILPNYVQTVASMFKLRDGAPSLFHSGVYKIGPNGEELGILEAVWGKCEIDVVETATRTGLNIGASTCFSRSLLNSFPPIKYPQAYEDLVWGFRAALINAVVYIDKPMVKYRVGIGMSWKQKQLGADTPDQALRKHGNKLIVQRDVLSQRLLDLTHVKKIENFEMVKEALENSLLETEIDCALLRRQTFSVKHFLFHFRAYRKRYKKLKKLKKSLKKR